MGKRTQLNGVSIERFFKGERNRDHRKPPEGEPLGGYLFYYECAKFLTKVLYHNTRFTLSEEKLKLKKRYGHCQPYFFMNV